MAFSKANRNSGLEVEDFVSLGYEVLETAKATWNPNKAAKFNTYFTMLLQRRFYKAMVATHRKKRGGAGSKEDDMRFGRGERWENGQAETEVVHHVSIEAANDDHASGGLSKKLQLPAVVDNSVEYDLLIKQIEKHVPQGLRVVFWQMVDPDEALLGLAHKRSIGQKICTIDTKLMAEYLQLDVAKLRSMKRQVQEIVAERLGVPLP